MQFLGTTSYVVVTCLSSPPRGHEELISRVQSLPEAQRGGIQRRTLTAVRQELLRHTVVMSEFTVARSLIKGFYFALEL